MPPSASSASVRTCSIVVAVRTRSAGSPSGPVAGSAAMTFSRVGRLGHALHPQRHLDHDLGELVGRLADRPAAVGGLAPRGPVDRDVGPHPGRLLLARQAVGGLPGHVAEEDVDLEALLDGLALQERPVEGGTDGADEVDEEMIEHAARG